MKSFLLLSLLFGISNFSIAGESTCIDWQYTNSMLEQGLTKMNTANDTFNTDTAKATSYLKEANELLVMYTNLSVKNTTSCRDNSKITAAMILELKNEFIRFANRSSCGLAVFEAYKSFHVFEPKLTEYEQAYFIGPDEQKRTGDIALLSIQNVLNKFEVVLNYTPGCNGNNDMLANAKSTYDGLKTIETVLKKH